MSPALLLRKLILICGVCALLVACGPRLQSFGPSFVPPHLTASHFMTRDKKALPYRAWLPAGGAANTQVVLLALHGFNMYGGHFQDAGPWWATQGIATYAYDQRGFGGSPERGIWGGEKAMTSDVGDMVGLLKARHPGRPVYVLGASMGAAIAISALARDLGTEISGAVLVAPAVWGADEMHPGLRFISWLLAHVMPWNYATGSAVRRMPSDNIAMLRANGRDRLNIFRTRFDTIYYVTEVMGQGQEMIADVTTPLLVLYGRKDEIIPVHAVRRMLAKIKAPHRVVIYPKGWHMLLRDLQAKTVWRDVASWLLKGDAALPSGFEQAKKHTAKRPGQARN